jgi:RNA polymerase sigma factor (sigma-70 family)
MTPAVIPPAALPDDPVRAALDDPVVRNELLGHALATLGKWLSDRPGVVRSEAAAEAVQETQLRALQKRADYVTTSGSVRAWLHGIMNLVLSEIARSLRRLPAQESVDHAAWEQLARDLTPPAEEAIANRLAVQDYLTQLPAEQQELLRLRYLEGLGCDAIAAHLDISVGNARVRLCRALGAIKAVAGTAPREDRP